MFMLIVFSLGALGCAVAGALYAAAHATGLAAVAFLCMVACLVIAVTNRTL